MKRTPAGVRALVPLEAEQRTQVVRKIQGTFESAGFRRVVTPTFELYDSISPGLGPYLKGECFNMLDRDGQLLALRPDMTAAVARLVAHQMKGQRGELKLYYSGPVFRRRAWQHEFYQSGVELIGPRSPEADVAVISCIDRALRNAGLKDYLIDVGHRDSLRRYKPAAQAALVNRDYSEFGRLPHLKSAPWPGAPAYLKKISQLLSKAGLKSRIQFNEGLVKDIAYYTGVIFEFISPRYGYVLASGGRYDQLLGTYGDHRPAVGGAIHVDQVLGALKQKQSAPRKIDTPHTTIAVPKGHLLRKTLELFSAAGYRFQRADIDDRQLSFSDRSGHLRFIVVRPTDVPVYVEHGAVDLGIVGKDILLETRPKVAELADLKFGRCRLVVAAPKNKKLSIRKLPHHVRVATKFTYGAEKFFADRGFDPQIIKLYGSVELGPLFGLADVIVDLVDTGNTLRANGLEIIDEIYTSTARLIANQSYLRARRAVLQPILNKLL